jgi:hypothetical protein
MANYLIEHTGAIVSANGRIGQTLNRLIASPRGVAAVDVPPGLRLSAYILRLRRLLAPLGVEIITKRERMLGGANIGRYILTAKIRRLGGGADE